MTKKEWTVRYDSHEKDKNQGVSRLHNSRNDLHCWEVCPCVIGLHLVYVLQIQRLPIFPCRFNQYIYFGSGNASRQREFWTQFKCCCSRGRKIPHCLQNQEPRLCVCSCKMWITTLFNVTVNRKWFLLSCLGFVLGFFVCFLGRVVQGASPLYPLSHRSNKIWHHTDFVLGCWQGRDQLVYHLTAFVLSGTPLLGNV